MKRVFIVHGWEFSPSDNWYPWLTKELERKGFSVQVPAMPDTKKPTIKKWVAALRNAVGVLDKNTFFVGHSIGCQTILRFLADTTGTAGGAVLVAPWTTLTPDALPTPAYERIAMQWLTTLLPSLKTAKTPVIAIFSDNDPYVPSDNIATFRKLGAKIVLDNGKGHFTADEGVTRLPSALEALLSLTSP